MTREDIKRFMERKSYKEKMVIAPLLSEKQILPRSIVIRLGLSIVVPRSLDVVHHDGTEAPNRPIRLQYGAKIFLPPRGSLWASTFEFFSFPMDVYATVQSLGVWDPPIFTISTRAIPPGFKGRLNLEISNAYGNNRIPLYPGHRIAQLVLCNKSLWGKYKKYNDKEFSTEGTGQPQVFPNKSLARNDDSGQHSFLDPWWKKEMIFWDEIHPLFREKSIAKY